VRGGAGAREAGGWLHTLYPLLPERQMKTTKGRDAALRVHAGAYGGQSPLRSRSISMSTVRSMPSKPPSRVETTRYLPLTTI
jgi:hypothetical protein